MAFKVLLFLTFLSVFSSQTAMDVFSVLLSLTFISSLFKNKSKPPFKLDTVRSFFVIWFFIILAGLFLQSDFIGMAKKTQEFLWVIFAYVLVGVFSKLDLKSRVREYMPYAFAVAGIISVASLGYFCVSDHEGRLEGVLVAPIITAHLYSLLFLFLSGYLVECFHLLKKDRPRLALYIFSLVLLGATIFLTMTRGVWISVFVALLFLTFMKSWKWLLSFIAVTGVSFAVLFTSWPQFHDRVLFAFNYQQNYDSERIALWKANWMIFQDHPILGAGYSRNTDLLPEYYEKMGLPRDQFQSHAHNQYLHFLAGTGVLGFACYIGFLGITIWMALRLRRQNQNVYHRGLLLGVGATFIGFMVGGLTEANFEQAKIKIMIAFLLSIVLYLRSDKRVEHQ